MAACSQAEVVKSWEKPLAPGMTFRMEVESNPARTIYGIKYDPKLVRAESRLAGGMIYEPGQFNGRSVVSQMVKEAGAQAGFNGDFFQWTPDPGGDPQGFMVSKGVLISAQGKGQRTAAYAWGPGTAGQVVQPKAVVTVSGLAGEMEVTTLNGKVAEGGLGLSFDLAGEIYGHAPLTVVHLDLAGAKLGLNGEMKATVKRVESAATRPAIAPGTAVLAGAGDWAAKLMAMPVGSSLTIKISIAHLGEGMTEAMGGGPVLLRGGAYAGPVEKADAPRHPRTAMGSTADGKVWSIVIDGRQTMSVGTTFTETAEVMKRWGCIEAVNLDGGGSSTLHALGVTLNRPSSGGMERAVANGVVLYSSLPSSEGLEELTLDFPKTMKVGDSASAKLLHKGINLADGLVIWTCQGAAWIDQEGTLRATAEGKATLTALVQGKVVRGEIEVSKP
jgi:hypothetical protein